MMDDLAAFDEFRMQVARGIEGQMLGALKAQPDGRGICSGRHNEIIFQLALVASVVDQVDAGVDASITNLRIRGMLVRQFAGSRPIK